jgi:hypothetical protein
MLLLRGKKKKARDGSAVIILAPWTLRQEDIKFPAIQAKNKKQTGKRKKKKKKKDTTGRKEASITHSEN